MDRRQALMRRQAGRHWNDPEALDGYAAAAESAARDRAWVEGITPDADELAPRVAAARSAVLRAAIEGALEAGDGARAIALFEQAREGFAPQDLDELGPQLDDVRELDTARAYVDRLLQPLPARPGDIDALHRAALEHNTVDWADNHRQHAANRHLIDTTLNGHREDAVLRQTDLERQLDQWLGQPRHDRQPWPPHALWTQLDQGQRQQFYSRVADSEPSSSAFSDHAEVFVEPHRLAENWQGQLETYWNEKDVGKQTGSTGSSDVHLAQADEPVTPRGFTYEWAPPSLDPHKLNKRISGAEQQRIATILGRVVQADFKGLGLHPYNNVPDPKTGAVLPPSTNGYLAVDVPAPDGTRGGRLVIERRTGTIYYTNTHYRSFYPVRLNPR